MTNEKYIYIYVHSMILYATFPFCLKFYLTLCVTFYISGSDTDTEDSELDEQGKTILYSFVLITILLQKNHYDLHISVSKIPAVPITDMSRNVPSLKLLAVAVIVDRKLSPTNPKVQDLIKIYKTRLKLHHWSQRLQSSRPQTQTVSGTLLSTCPSLSLTEEGITHIIISY